MDPFDEPMKELVSGDLERPTQETSTSKDDPLDVALLDMVPILPDF